MERTGAGTGPNIRRRFLFGAQTGIEVQVILLLEMQPDERGIRHRHVLVPEVGQEASRRREGISPHLAIGNARQLQESGKPAWASLARPRRYRVTLTDHGRSFHDRARVLLADLTLLGKHASQLAMGEEAELRIVLGDLCPLPEVLGLLRHFFKSCPETRLHLYFEAISGPWERLFDNEADLIVHHIDKTDPRLEFIDLFAGTLLPVVAPNFLPFPISKGITPEQMRGHVQCVIRDTALRWPARDYYLIEGARTWTVSDQQMKKEIILQGMGWGHMPGFMIADELRDGRLLSIAGKHLRGGGGEIVAARRRDAPHGPVANRLWSFVAAQAPALSSTIKRRSPGRH
jgi:DNA-binding transcriptional LysR family regulator